MLILLSPAKTLAADPAGPAVQATAARLADHSAQVLAALSALTATELADLMGISGRLAARAAEQAAALAAGRAAHHPALWTYDGPSHRAFEPATLTPEGVAAAQRQLRILSGLYGLLRPLDAIAPHRLEMGTRLPGIRHRSLDAFWRQPVTALLIADARACDARAVLDVASVEYGRAVEDAQLPVPRVRPVFLDPDSQGRLRVLSVHAKRARGAMARWAIDAQPTRIDDLRAFDRLGYRYDDDRSSGHQPAFVRAGAEPLT